MLLWAQKIALLLTVIQKKIERLISQGQKNRLTQNIPFPVNLYTGIFLLRFKCVFTTEKFLTEPTSNFSKLDWLLTKVFSYIS